ncbi:MAG: AtpZ/AtpI family protein [Candidatus Wallbacteria bacterium]
MNEANRKKIERQQEEFTRTIGEKEERKVKARAEKPQSIWFGVGMAGVIGWSVSVPILIGVAAGLWLDNNYPMKHSWTLSLISLGVFVGCLNAWQWVEREGERIKKERQKKEDDNEDNKNE